MKQAVTAAVIAGSLALAGCQSASQEEQEPINPTAQQSVYKGMLPCADCSGVRTTLTLYRDQYGDTTRFLLKEEYLQGSRVTKSSVERGDWTAQDKIVDNTRLEVFTLNPQTPDAQRLFLKDAVNAIELLDKDGNPIDSNQNYRLLKK